MLEDEPYFREIQNFPQVYSLATIQSQNMNSLSIYFGQNSTKYLLANAKQLSLSEVDRIIYFTASLK